MVARPKANRMDSIQFSCLNDRVNRWFYGFFFYFPRPLAEENG